MRAIQRRIELKFEHRILFTENLFDQSNPVLERVLLGHGSDPPPKVLVILDENLHAAEPGISCKIEEYFFALKDRVHLAGAPVVLEGGERLKNSYFHVSKIHSEIDRHNIDRHSYLMAVGGGALLDVAGLAAATAHRGIRLVRVPSTTLSQADSGVGIKNGINAFGKKNFVGTFAVPFAVINDLTLLRTLPPRHKRSGYSEAVKVACIQDAGFFEAIEAEAAELRAFKPASMQRLIHRSAELHVEHIAGAGDPFEFGSARPLDFGHWAAHKLEQLSEFRITHGEAVAVGIALDATYSRRKGFLDSADAERVLELLEALGFEIYAHELCNVDSLGELALLGGLGEFRSHLGGELSVTLLRRIGEGFETHQMDDAVNADAIRELQRRHFGRGIESFCESEGSCSPTGQELTVLAAPAATGPLDPPPHNSRGI
jgi:3-dehydroquinate synthase